MEALNTHTWRKTLAILLAAALLFLSACSQKAGGKTGFEASFQPGEAGTGEAVIECSCVIKKHTRD